MTGTARTSMAERTAAARERAETRAGASLKQILLSCLLIVIAFNIARSLAPEPVRLGAVAAGLILIVALFIDYMGPGDVWSDRGAWMLYVTSFRSLVVGTGYTEAVTGKYTELVKQAADSTSGNAAQAITAIGGRGVVGILVVVTLLALWPAEWVPRGGVFALGWVQAAFALRIKSVGNKRFNWVLITDAALLVGLEPLKAGGAGELLDMILWAAQAWAGLVAAGLAWLLGVSV